ncbi:MAG TPA: GrpB family protein [Firmicutes bacterium]|nr:GrpB family protein [Bacillota bacterium]
MIGLKRGTVKLLPHQKEWNENAEHTIKFLKRLLGNTALDIQHIGSTSILLIHAKPIIDIAVAVHDVNDIMPYVEALKQRQQLLHEEAVAGQAFFVIENGDIRTHHIHIVKWNGADWNNYINFRDYLNANPEKAMLYGDLKQKLAMQFSHDRKSYTAGKQGMIGQLLSEAGIWKLKSSYLSGPAVIKADKR